MPGNYKLKRILRYMLAVFFLVAGINHFRDPGFYFPLIPEYLPWPKTINGVSGILEIIFGGLLFFKKYRIPASYGILALLVLFIPSHIHFIQLGSCVENSLCVPGWVGWLRLIVIHPLLLFWVWCVKDVT